ACLLAFIYFAEDSYWLRVSIEDDDKERASPMGRPDYDRHTAGWSWRRGCGAESSASHDRARRTASSRSATALCRLAFRHVPAFQHGYISRPRMGRSYLPAESVSSHRSRYRSMGRGGTVCQHDLGMPDHPASRWVLYLADEDGGGKRGADVTFNRRGARLCKLVPQGRSPSGALLFHPVAARRYPPFQRHSSEDRAHQ